MIHSEVITEVELPVIDWPAHLRAFRLRHDLTQKKLSDLLLCALRTVEHWEQGDRAPPAYLKLALAHIATKLTRESEYNHG